jgi:sugar (pentulose or hexulose) kinase
VIPDPGTARGPLILAIDLGSSSIKVATVDDELRVRAVATARHQTVGDSAGRREHRPGQTWSAVLGAARRVLAEVPDRSRIVGIAVTGPRGSLLIADGSGSPRTNALSWQDRRSATLAGSVDRASASEFRMITGAAFDPAVGLPKLLWLRDSTPGAFVGEWQIATPQSDVLRRLGADPGAVDLSVAAHVGLLDIRSLGWSDRLMERHAIPSSALPRLVTPGTAVGRLSRRAAGILGLPAHLPLVAAASDGICSELGAGVVDPGQRYAYLGTASALAGPVPSPTLPDDESIMLMPGSVVDRWRLVGLGMAGASARAWFMAIAGVRDEGRFDRLVGSSPPGARGVTFLPTLAGATAPVRDPRARGLFAGLSLESSRGDLARAVLEGVGLELGWLNRAMGTADGASDLRLTGGGSRSTIWAQILADIFGVPVERVVEPNPGLRGAAAYGWAAVDGPGSVLDWARDHPTPSQRFEPIADRRPIYAEAAGIYAELRTALHDAGLDERLADAGAAGGVAPSSSS